MAILCPSDLVKLELNHEHSGEMETLLFLKKALPDTFHLFHGMHWSNESVSHTRFGEIDFVIVDPAGKVIMIEQKNGRLEQEKDGDLIKRYGSYRKSISKQIHRIRENILDKYQQQHRGRTLKMDYLFYCPDYRVANVSGIAIDYSRIVDKNKTEELPAIISELLDADARETRIGKEVLAFFYNEYHLVPDVGTYKSHQKENFVRLSSDMMHFVERLDMSPYRLHVQGTAGSGKSLLASRMYTKWQSEGERVLLTCFNNALQASFRASLPAPENIKTFHKLCTDALKAHQQVVDFNQCNEQDFWQSVLDKVATLKLTEQDKYDAVIVDEGQDFSPRWYDMLHLFLKEDGKILWLDDPSQQIYKKETVELAHFVHFYADINFRTPQSIANYIRSTLKLPFTSRNALPGLGVHIEQVDTKSELNKKVAHRIKELRKIGFDKRDIVILSCKALDKSGLAQSDGLAGVKLKRFTGYCKDGKPRFSDGDVLFDSVYRFKGQQAPAVILVDLDMPVPLSDMDRKRLFVGMTRATVRLEIIIDENQALLNVLKHEG